jgi:Putative Ig domain
LAAALGLLAFAPGASANAGITINSFTYDPSDSTGQTLILTATYTGSSTLDQFYLFLGASGNYTISQVVVTSGSSTSTMACTPEMASLPTVHCTFPPPSIVNGDSFTITFKVSPGYPPNQPNDYSADDGTGFTTGMITGPTPPVAPCPTITVGPPSLPTGSPGQPYSEMIGASGGANPYTFTLGGGSLPPGITLAPNGTLSGTPTTPGTYNFVVNVLDANNCPGTRSFMIDVFQPVTPAPCKCSVLKLKLDPTLLNMKGLAPDKHDFGVGFVWRMTCTTGGGGCTATILFRPPVVFAGAVPLPKHNFHLNVKRMTFTCSGPCATSTTGRFQIKMLSRGQLNTLFGRTLAYQVVTKCGGVTKVITVKVFIDDHGVLRRPH